MTDTPRLSSSEHITIEMMVWWITEGFSAIDAALAIGLATAHVPTWAEVRRAVNQIVARMRGGGT